MSLTQTVLLDGTMEIHDLCPHSFILLLSFLEMYRRAVRPSRIEQTEGPLSLSLLPFASSSQPELLVAES